MNSPIVIAGCGRSGTSLLLSVLSCHPELHAIGYETSALTENPLRLEHFPTDRRWVEKTPANVHNLGAILDGIPDCLVIHMVRDGRDVCTSMHPLWNGPYISIDRWVADVSAGARWERHKRVMVVRYRDLVRDYERTVYRLCAFLRLTLADEFEDYPLTATVQTHAAWSGPARPLSDSSIGRWKLPEHAAAIAEFMQNRKAVSLLKRYQFEV